MKRARMKPGVRPVVVDGCTLVPEYPTYWTVPARDEAAVALMVSAGEAEYEPVFARGDHGQFAVPTLQNVAPAPRPPARGRR